TCRMGEHVGAYLSAPGRGDSAAVWRRLPAIRADPWIVSAILRQTDGIGVGAALHPAQHRADPRGLQSQSDHAEAVSRRTEPDLRHTGSQQGHDRKYKIVGLATAGRYLRPAAGDPHLLQAARSRRRSLLA